MLANLLDLHAVEATPVIEKVFAANAIDETIAGDWDDVQWELGLTEEPPQREPVHFPEASNWPFAAREILGDRPPRDREAKAKAKAKRKQAANHANATANGKRYGGQAGRQLSR
jgi:hypothetical protein